MIRCIRLPKKEEGKGAAASVQTITKKNGWDEHRPVIFANPPTFTQRTRGGRDGDVGRGTYIGDGSDVLTDPELAGHRRLPQPHPAYRRSGVPSRPSL